MSLPICEPTQFAAGESLAWQRTFADYAANDGWQLAYYFRGPGDGFEVSASADGAAHRVEVSREKTQALLPGVYAWQAWASRGEESRLVDQGQTTVAVSLHTIAGAHDVRSPVKRVLDALDALLEGKATLDQKRYQINNRELERYGPAELIAWRMHYARLYAQEQQAQRQTQTGEFFPRTILTRFEVPQ